MLAIGGDLRPGRILAAYQQGIFPWYDPGHPILWWSPNPRLILYPSNFKISRSLKKRLKKPYRLTIDTQFTAIISACANANGRLNNTWITPEMQEAYTNLHEMGFAHSFEIWLEGRLVGGLYGLSLGRLFFGESMFNYETDASKIAVYYLCQVLNQHQFEFIDCQLPTPHLLTLGAIEIHRRDYLERLKISLENPNFQGKWTNWAE